MFSRVNSPGAAVIIFNRLNWLSIQMYLEQLQWRFMWARPLSIFSSTETKPSPFPSKATIGYIIPPIRPSKPSFTAFFSCYAIINASEYFTADKIIIYALELCRKCRTNQEKSHQEESISTLKIKGGFQIIYLFIFSRLGIVDIVGISLR